MSSKFIVTPGARIRNRDLPRPGRVPPVPIGPETENPPFAPGGCLPQPLKIQFYLSSTIVRVSVTEPASRRQK